MRKTIYILTAAVFVFNSLAISAEDKKIFKDSEYGYSLKYPKNWNASIYRSGIVLANINSSDNQSGIQIRREKTGSSLKSFESHYVKKFMQDMNAEMLDRKKIKINKKEALTISFKAKRGGTVYFLKSYIIHFPAKKEFYIFQAGTPFKNRKKIETIIDSIAESFSK